MQETSHTDEQKSSALFARGGSPLRGMLFAAGILALALLLYTVREIAHPFVVCALVLFILSPLRRDARVRRVMWAAALLALGWGVYDVSGVLAPFAVAFLFAFLFDPAVTYAERFMPRWVSALAIIVVILGAIVALGVFVVPPLFAQLGALLQKISVLVAGASNWVSGGGLTAMLQNMGIPQENVRTFVMDQISPRLQSVLETLVNGAMSFVSGVSGVLGQFVNAIVIPILGFYLLKDFPALRQSARRVLNSVDVSQTFASAVKDIDALLSAYLRGQMLVAVAIGALASVLFAAFGIPFAFVLGFMILVFDFVPFVGLIASLLVAECVVLFGASPGWSGVIVVAAIILLLHGLESYVLAPRLIGKKVGLHPVVVILSLFVFARLMGFFGMLIAVPSTAVIAYLIRRWFARRRGDAEGAA